MRSVRAIRWICFLVLAAAICVAFAASTSGVTLAAPLFAGVTLTPSPTPLPQYAASVEATTGTWTNTANALGASDGVYASTSTAGGTIDLVFSPPVVFSGATVYFANTYALVSVRLVRTGQWIYRGQYWNLPSSVACSDILNDTCGEYVDAIRLQGGGTNFQVDAVSAGSSPPLSAAQIARLTRTPITTSAAAGQASVWRINCTNPTPDANPPAALFDGDITTYATCGRVSNSFRGYQIDLGRVMQVNNVSVWITTTGGPHYLYASADGEYWYLVGRAMAPSNTEAVRWASFELNTYFDDLLNYKIRYLKIGTTTDPNAATYGEIYINGQPLVSVPTPTASVTPANYVDPTQYTGVISTNCEPTPTPTGDTRLIHDFNYLSRIDCYKSHDYGSLVFDLKQSKTINSVSVYQSSVDFNCGSTVAGSLDGVTYQDIVSFADCDALLTYPLPAPQTWRFLRVMYYALWDRTLGLNEFLVNGLPVGDATVTATPTYTASATPGCSNTATPGAGTATATGTLNSCTSTPTTTPTLTLTSAATNTQTGGGGGGGGSTSTPAPTSTPVPTGTSTSVPTATAQPTFTPTLTPSNTPSSTPTATVANPAPFLFTSSPSNVPTGSVGQYVTLTGSGFIPDSVAHWDGTPRSTTYVSSTELKAFITSTDFSAAGTYDIAVYNPAPGGGTSNSLSFTVGTPATPTGTPSLVPGLISMTPSSASAGGAVFELTVVGANFTPSSIVRWNGTSRITTFVDGGTLTANITASDIMSAGSATVTVFNPSPGGGTSNALTFVISGPTATPSATATITNTPAASATNNPAPFITDVSPPTVQAGAAGQTISVTGTGFALNSQVKWAGTGRATTYVDATHLSFAVTSSDLATAGTFAITVDNPSPGGGTSNTFNFVVTAPTNTPTLTRTPTSTITPNATQTQSAQLTATSSQLTLTAAPPATQTQAANQTATSLSRTATASAPTNTPSDTPTPTLTNTPSDTPTPTLTRTNTVAPTPSNTPDLQTTSGVQTATSAAKTSTAAAPPSNTPTLTLTPTNAATSSSTSNSSGGGNSGSSSPSGSATGSSAVGGSTGVPGSVLLPGSSGSSSGSVTGGSSSITAAPSASETPTPTATPEFSEPRKFTVQGFIDRNNDGRMSPDETITNVRIVLTNEDGSYRDTRAIVGGVVTFDLPRLPAGTVLTASAPYLHRRGAFTLPGGGSDINATVLLRSATYPLYLP